MTTSKLLTDPPDLERVRKVMSRLALRLPGEAVLLQDLEIRDLLKFYEEGAMERERYRVVQLLKQSPRTPAGMLAAAVERGDTVPDPADDFDFIGAVLALAEEGLPEETQVKVDEDGTVHLSLPEEPT